MSVSTSIDNLISEMFRDVIRKYLRGYRKPKKYKGTWSRFYEWQQKHKNDNFERAKEFLFEKGVLEKVFNYLCLDMNAGYIRKKVLKRKRNKREKIKFLHLRH